MRLDRVEFGQGVHIGEQLVAVSKSRNLVGFNHSYTQLVHQVEHPELTARQTLAYDRSARLRVRGAQWMIAAFGARNDEVCVGGQREEVGEQRALDMRHVAREQQDVVMSGGERCVEARERAAAGHPVLHRNDVVRDRTCAAITDQEDAIHQRPQRVDLPLQNRAAAHAQRRLVRAAHAPGQSACENRRASHTAPILLRA
jgi:hypothetical protein